MPDDAPANAVREPKLTVLALSAEPLLRALAAAPGASSKALAEASGKKVNNIARDLDVLAGAGLIVRHPPRLAAAGVEALQAIDRANAALAGPPQVPAADAGAVPPGFVLARHADIRPDPAQDRKAFDDAGLEALADSIAAIGLRAPPTLIESADGAPYMLHDGERRWRAWGLLIGRGVWAPERAFLCPLATDDELGRREAALAANAARADLNHMEYARAFERLAQPPFGRSNKQIAEVCCRTPEFVQQHRRLAHLAEADQARVASGALPLHEALAILARPKPKPLEPAELLVLAEIGAAVLKSRGSLGYGTLTVQASAEAGLPRQLRSGGLVGWNGEHWQSGLCTLTLTYPGAARLREWLPDLERHPEVVLAKLRAAVSARLGADGYTTPWLNGPFEPTPEAAARIAEREQRDALDKQARERDRAERAANQRLLRSYAERAEAMLPDALTSGLHAPLFDVLPHAAKAAAHPLPWRWSEEDGILDADGDPVEINAYEAADFDRLVVAAVNAAAGVATPPPTFDRLDRDEDEATEEGPE